MALKNLSYSHEALADAILANPLISQGDLAITFGYTEAWISTIIRSDAFQALLSERRSKLSDPLVRQALELRFQNMASRALSVLEHKLQKDPEEISDKLALRAAELGAKVSGIGESHNTIVINPNRISELAERISKLNRTNGNVIEAVEKNPSTETADANAAGTPTLSICNSGPEEVGGSLQKGQT